jgi:glycosyltransferase involved in cell wall biosynthesis
LEQDILEAADVVIAVSEGQRQILADHVSGREEKVLTITNGFDPADFPNAVRVQPTDRSRFVLTFVGRFQLARTGEELFGGLRRFVEGLGPDSGRFLLRVVGYANKTVQARLRDTGAECEFVDYVPHEEAIRAMCSADALLLKALTGRNGDSVIPAKLFEYLASGRPILAVGPRGCECERIVRSCSAGLTAEFDETAIADALERLFDAWTMGRPIAGCGPEGLQAYSRIELTRRLASVFDRLADRAAEPAETADESLETCAR